MRAEKLTKNHEAQLIELLASDRENPQVEYYLERKNGFWKPYDWYSKGQNEAWGVFENDSLIGATALVKLPFSFDPNHLPFYLNTDYFVHFKYRKSRAAYQLLKMLQENAPVGGECFEIGIENQPGFLTPLAKISEKYGHTTVWVQETTLTQFFVSHLKNYSTQIVQRFSSDSGVIEEHFKNYLADRQNHAILKFDESIHISDLANIQFFELKNGNEFIKGLLFDKVELQKVIWNGQPRLYIEKYRRMLNQNHQDDLSAGRELPFLHLNFLQYNIQSADFMNQFINSLNNFCFDKKYFCWTVRDLKSPFLHVGNVDRLNFSCRIPLTSNTSPRLESTKKVLDKKRIVLESIFL